MSLYHPNTKSTFAFIIFLLFSLLVLMIPLRPSVWDRDDLSNSTVANNTTTTIDSNPSSKSETHSLPSTTIKQDNNHSLTQQQSSSTTNTTTSNSQEEEEQQTTLPIVSDTKANTSPPSNQNIAYLLFLLSLIGLLAFGGYKWLIARWKKQYWLRYNAALHPLNQQTSTIDFDIDFSSLEQTQNHPLDQPTEDRNAQQELPPKTPLTKEEDKEETAPATATTDKNNTSNTPEETTIIQDQAIYDGSTSTPQKTGQSISTIALLAKELLFRLPYIVWQIGRGITSIFSFFSKGNTKPKKPLDLKWQDGVSVCMILLFIPFKNILFPYQPTSVAANLFIGFLVWASPSLLRLHWGWGVLGILLILTEFFSLVIYAILQALKDMPAGNIDYRLFYLIGGVIFLVGILVWAKKKQLLPSLASLAKTAFWAIIGYVIFLPYFTVGWDYAGLGDIIPRFIIWYMIYEVGLAFFSRSKVKPAINSQAPAPISKTKDQAAKIAQKEKSKKEVQKQPTAEEEEVTLKALFNRPNWYKKVNLSQLERVYLPQKELDEQSEFIVLYLPDCINAQELYLSNNNFQEFPYEITELEELRVLNLSHNQIEDIIPDIAYLKHLDTLFLTHNNISTIPDEMAELSNLAHLDLRGNPLTVEAIHKLESFFPKTYLLVDDPIETPTSNNSTTTDESPSLVKKVKHLLKKELKKPEEVYYLSTLAQQDLPDLPTTVLSPFKSLTSLLLYSNAFTSIPEVVYQFPKLRKLMLSFNQINVVPKEIGQLENLQELDLSNNPIQNISIEITTLNKLKTLELANIGLTKFPAFLLKLLSLEHLNLNGNHILRIPDTIQVLEQLKTLNLGFSGLNQFPNAIFDLSNLQTLIWTGNSIEKLPAQFAQLTKLRKLDIGFNPALKDDIQVLTQIPSLKELHISGLRTALSKPILETVGQLQQLETLWMSYNDLQEVPNSIQSLKQLRFLSLAHNQLTELPALIGKLDQLEYLYLENNQLIKLPKELRSLTKLRYIDLRNNPLGIQEKRALQRLLPSVTIKF